jgi:hypothetical protein
VARTIDLDQVEAHLREMMASPFDPGEASAGAIWSPLSELPGLLSALPRCVDPGIQYGFNVVDDQAWIIVHAPGDTAAAVASAGVLMERERRHDAAARDQ